MAHGTRVNGTAYGITNGKCFVNGTLFNIKSGKTLIQGTNYTINLAGKTTIAVIGTTTYLSMGMVELYINEEKKMKGGKYNYEAGQEVSVHVITHTSRNDITINGESKGKDVNFDATGLEVTIKVGEIVNITY